MEDLSSSGAQVSVQQWSSSQKRALSSSSSSSSTIKGLEAGVPGKKDPLGQTTHAHAQAAQRCSQVTRQPQDW